MSLHTQLINWRRDFHQHPELGFLEMRTATKVADELDKLGYDIKIGREVMNPDFTMGKPTQEETAAHYDWAKENGAVLEYLDKVADGYTGIAATLDTGIDGPVVVFRVDMDALPIYESEESSHFPLQEGFRSVNNEMHACGHDVHTSIALGLATLLVENKTDLKGTIKILFQPAEEGTRGARSMVEAGVVDDADFFIASHIGTGVPFNHFLASNNGFLATTKLDVSFKGVSSHAGGQPEEGKNAMLAAANAVINLNAIPRHSGGATRINVGELHAGSGRNVIADSASLKIETRGTTSELNDYMKQYAESIIKGAAQMFQVDYTIETVGEGKSAKGSTELARVLAEAADSENLVTELEENKPSGSEDATFFINRVQEQGGQASYCIFGTELAAGHHNEKFDVNEDSMISAVQTLFKSAVTLTNK
ncbi:amidohydrolase [Jeotgalicoccus psychrophilus]|uniref:amidohydrolase n=1 Tax=Jeotgalicoccus psychrophilus TaxID=157228 RepID=UPI0004210693|nr:amidohydrolase [Jeotgalicoccus psychrophilus]